MPGRSRFLVIAGAALALAGILGAFLIGRSARADELQIPDRLGKLILVETQSGAAAAAEIQRLHGRAFPLASAAVARYGPAGEASLWVAGTVSEDEAAALLEAMHLAIETADSPFTAQEPQVIAGVTVYPLRGMGQEHMYFQSGRLVLWLAADAGVAETARLAVVEAYR
jgi:hypothetical protein